MKYSSNSHLLAIAMPICMLGFSSALQAAVIYTETFDNITGANQSFNSAGVNWSVHRTSSATAYTLSGTDITASPVISNGASVNGVAPTGFLFQSSLISGSVGTPHIWWTNETTFGDISLLDSLTVDLRNGSTNEDLRFALQVGSSWYVSQSVFNNSVADAATLNLSLDVENASYFSLNFTPGVTLSMGTAASLPLSGTVTAVGLFTQSRDSANIRIDNFRVSAIPEPSTALLGSLGVLALLRRRRR